MTTKKRTVVLVCAGVFFLFVIGAAAVAIVGAVRERSDGGASEDYEQTLSAYALWHDYHVNEKAADRKYRGKVLRVHGTVYAVKPDAIALLTLTFTGEKFAERDKFWQETGFTPMVVYCRFDPSLHASFAMAKRGETFYVTGRCVDQRIDEDLWRARIILLEDCRPAP